MIDHLNRLYDTFTKELTSLTEQAQVLKLKADYLGKKGAISDVLKGLSKATQEERKTIGPLANDLKSRINSDVALALKNLERAAIDKQLESETIDKSYRDSIKSNAIIHGGLHPVSLIQQEIEDVFLSMGFEVIDGPHIDDEYHNFEALNIPGDHPARDMQDTFWFHQYDDDTIDNKYVLRTQTSTLQVRGMKTRKPPFKFIAPGKVFRCERTDASHESVFHQLEGMMVDKDIKVSHLIYIMKTMLAEIFQQDVKIRLRPGYFPFVEPGFELDIQCLICKGKGCSVCKQVGWLELLPCGMIHPNVLAAGNIDSSQYSGFAFGLGLDRLVMMRYGIDDIRHLHSGDLRFLQQFQTY